MPRQKVSDNVYYDERCTEYPYYVNIMRRGYNLYQKFKDEVSAINARDTFINKHETLETDHPLIFIRNGCYVLEVTIVKEFDNYEEAKKKADIMLRFADEG